MHNLLIPVKKHLPLPGLFHVGKTLSVSSIHASDDLPLSSLKADLANSGKRIILSKNDPKAQLLVRRDRSLQNAEAYHLKVSPDRIEIVSSSDAGAYYGIMTLREILRVHPSRIPCWRIEDRPAFARRGIYLECSRGKVPTLATLTTLAERLAQWKINELQVYIENVFTFKKHPLIGRGYSPFTPDDLLAVQKHCKKHHIRFVPSLSSFGHMEKILNIPKYQPLGEMPGFRGYPGGSTLCPGDPRSIRLVEDLYSEFVPLFEAEDFNVCGDEPWELGQGRSKSRADKIGTGAVYLEFILKLHKLCQRHGKRMNMWGDIVLKHPEIIPQIPKDIVLLNWGYQPDSPTIPRTREFSQAGLPFLCCPGTNSWQSHGSRLQYALDNVALFAKTGLRYGAEGLLHTDWGDGGHRNTLGISLASFAHGAAHAWNSPGVDNASHMRRFTFHHFRDTTGRLAESLRVLGKAESHYWAYHALVELLGEPKQAGKPIILSGTMINTTHLTESQIAKRLHELDRLAWPPATASLPGFEKIALEEFALATEMDRLAWERYVYARKIRGSASVGSGLLKKHAHALRCMAKEFSRLWMARNRPSRLHENMQAFEEAAKDAEKHSKQ